MIQRPSLPSAVAVCAHDLIIEHTPSHVHILLYTSSGKIFIQIHSQRIWHASTKQGFTTEHLSNVDYNERIEWPNILVTQYPTTFHWCCYLYHSFPVWLLSTQI